MTLQQLLNVLYILRWLRGIRQKYRENEAKTVIYLDAERNVHDIGAIQRIMDRHYTKALS
jgi:hypothetical protein